MNILVITPLYYIEGRPKLYHDTSSIHYLVREWVKKHNVLVVDVYFETLRRIGRYISSEERNFRKGYKYEIDGVRVGLIEVMRPFKQGSRLSRYEKNRVIKYINKFTADNSFKPDMIVTHIPITVVNAVAEVFCDIPKIAVLHSTDRRYWSRNKSESKKVRQTFDAFFARSKDIRDFFDEQQLEGLKHELIYSGGKKADSTGQKSSDRISIMYAGKLIPQKHVEVVIEALSLLKEKYDFRFEIYGDGTEMQSLRELAGQRLDESDYFFAGSVEREKILSAMSRNDFFVMVSENECFGLTYVEAMINDCIPIGSKGEGIDGVIVDGYNGFLVRTNEVIELTDCLDKCFSMKSEEKNVILKNIAESKKAFSEEGAGNNYLTLIEAEYKRLKK
ncbi:glycosyltransferase family 4 protein [Butyrivibrio sp. WCD3002]|uniref:glycosyltransferase family 4 protein n=1 Tax=Butyrivibrio sp. WCD3002 TaxID=1280676 RepID=UPI0003F711EA|nr:glycosyltransferase family 4 protein [Butyrivibrio sp. WCD3002]